MTPDEIRRQIMHSAGLDAEGFPEEVKSVELTEETPAAGTEAETPSGEQLPEEATPPRPEVETPSDEQVPAMPEPRGKSIVLALLLAILFGPFGLIYVSWKRALEVFLVFVGGVLLIPHNVFVTLLLWFVPPILSIIALGVGTRPPTSEL